MGNVSARDREYDDEGKTNVNLDRIAANVTRVHVNGLVRTQDDVIVPTVEPVLKVKQFEELVLAAQHARNRLQELGCFEGVEIQIDTSAEGGSNDYEVTFEVEELRRIKGSVNTMVGSQEGSIMSGLQLPNMLGRGEKFQLDYSYGTKKTNQFNASFAKPFRSSLVNGEKGPLLATVTASLFQQMAESIPSSYKETGRGSLLDVSFLSAPQVAHNLQLETVWRQLNLLNNASSFAVRGHCGHTLKASLKHIMTVDRRDNPVFPSDGSLFRFSQEFAGLGGDISFLKNELELQANLPIFALPKLFGDNADPCILQSSIQCGYLKRMASSDKTTTLSDYFYLGGPLNVRGFDMRGLGPSSEGDATGGSMYWATGVHLYTPLPFKNSTGGSGFSDLFRTHSFVTAGNLLSSYRYDSSQGMSTNVDEALRNFRLSYGVGLALKLGAVARVELNYCVPVRTQPGDKVAPGLQLGVGVNFL